MKRATLWAVMLAAAVAAAGGIVFLRRPASPEEMKKTTQPPEPETPQTPVQVRFEGGSSGMLNEVIPVDLVIEWPSPETNAAGLVGTEVKLEFLLRLPEGVQLRSAEWTPTPIPPEEKKEDPTGTWSLFELRKTLTTPSDPSAKEVTREKIKLAVVEKGINWVISTRVRFVWGSLYWQAFGVVFATVDDQGRVEFHAVPRGLETQQRAETD